MFTYIVHGIRNKYTLFYIIHLNSFYISCYIYNINIHSIKIYTVLYIYIYIMFPFNQDGVQRKQEKTKTDPAQPMDICIISLCIRTESQRSIYLTCGKTQKGQDQIQGLQPSKQPSVTSIYTQRLSWLSDTTQTGCVQSDNLR